MIFYMATMNKFKEGDKITYVGKDTKRKWYVTVKKVDKNFYRCGNEGYMLLPIEQEDKWELYDKVINL